MRQLLVTGATGELGRRVAPRATARGWAIRQMSRGGRPAGFTGDWAQADLLSGEGIEAAVHDVDVIIHCASSPFKDALAVEREGTARLLAAARQSGVSHVVYVSIVGIDQIDYDYYRAKLAGEEVVASGGVPFTIIRMTQFYSLIDRILAASVRGPLHLVPSGWRFQPLAPEEAADILVELAEEEPAGRVSDCGGPAVRTLDDMAPAWQAATGRRKHIMRWPMPGGLSGAFRSGRNLVPDNPVGVITWAQWLDMQYRSDLTGGRAQVA